MTGKKKLIEVPLPCQINDLSSSGEAPFSRIASIET